MSKKKRRDKNKKNSGQKHKLALSQLRKGLAAQLPESDVSRFIHTSCCDAHWELVLKKDGTYDLLCELCHKRIKPTFLVMSTEPTSLPCECPSCRTRKELSSEDFLKRTLAETIDENASELDRLTESGASKDEIMKRIDELFRKKLCDKLHESGLMPPDSEGQVKL